MIKKGRIVALLLVLYLFLGGCQTIIPTSDEMGVQETRTGGQQLGSDVNVKSIAVASSAQETTITLHFIRGSRNSKVSESKLNAVPAYSATILPSPERLCLTVQADYWDYGKDNEWYRNSLVCGSFNTVNSGADSISIYFQLNGRATASLAENKDTLTITLKPVTVAGGSSYFVGLNAYEEYEQNLISADLGFTPTLCTDASNIILISKPFETAAEAETFASTVDRETATVAATKKSYVFELETGKLPAYNASIDIEEVNQKQVIKTKDGGITLPVLVENGRYLCTAPDGSILYARSYFPDEESSENKVQKERLWLIGKNEKKTELALPDFSFVEQAAYSKDGRYIAILDTSADNKLLYVYDTDSGDLINLGEEGFGNLTFSFTWDTEKNTIYAMTGFSMMQLKKYDFDAEKDHISSVESALGVESYIATDGKSIYFADPQASQIIAVNIATGMRTPVCPGISFKLSPDGTTMAVVAPAADKQQDLFDLKTVNLLNGEASDVLKSIYVEDYEFGLDSSELFFTTSSYIGTGGMYHNAFLQYSVSDKTTEMIGYSTAEILRRGNTKNEMYLIDFFDSQENSFYVTYIYSF